MRWCKARWGADGADAYAATLTRCEAPPGLQTTHLCVTYGRKTACQDVTLSVNAGSITALIGPSGCGKTSFLLSLNRLTDFIPGCRVSGRIRMGTLDVLAPDIDRVALRRRVGMVFQKPNPFPLSIRRNLSVPLREHGVKEQQQLAARLEGALQEVGLWHEVKDRLDSSALRLSGGQQQRLCLARALVLQPEVLLMDEPCSALDPLASGRVEELIASLRHRYTVLLVTHNLAQARRLADAAAFFWGDSTGGRLIECGPVDQIFEAPQHNLTAEYVQGRRG